ncbi:hypothetical protein GCM10023116_18660 [Kistimonas scapharcae]|uniref:Uncharacterized protein n=1 Tax=Kistimonas scapharcae TaxID=1036133 RepID=A0ABP8V3Z9_9GAMM
MLTNTAAEIAEHMQSRPKKIRKAVNIMTQEGADFDGVLL